MERSADYLQHIISATNGIVLTATIQNSGKDGILVLLHHSFGSHSSSVLPPLQQLFFLPSDKHPTLKSAIKQRPNC